MAKATWGGKVIAESSACKVVEGNQYFPVEAVKKEFLKPSAHTSECPWKGTAHYYSVEVDGMRNDNAACITRSRSRLRRRLRITSRFGRAFGWTLRARPLEAHRPWRAGAQHAAPLQGIGC